MGSTSAAALDATCGLLDKVSGMEATSGDKVLGYHDREQGFALTTGAKDNKSVLGELAANLEGQVLDCCRVDSHRKHLGHHADAIGGEVGFGYEFLAELCHTLLHRLFYLLAESGIFGNGLLHGGLNVLGIVEESTDAGQGIRKIVEDFFGSSTGNGFDTAHSSGHTALADDVEQSNLAGSMGVTSAAELYAGTELHHADTVAVLLTEEGEGAKLAGFVDGEFTEITYLNVLTNHGIHTAFHLTEFLGSDLLEMAEVETEIVGGNERTLLLDMSAEDTAQAIVEKVGGSMVALAGKTTLRIDGKTE